MSYSDLEYEIFSRQFILKDFSEKNISKLHQSKISIIGLGGIGCSLSRYLISAGLKNLIIIDGDKVEISNLGRQILYNLKDVGSFKTIISKEKLLQANPNCNINIHSEYLSKKNINLILESDIVIDTTDDWQTSKLINDFCVKKSFTYIFSSAINHNIQICLFKNKEKHVCLNCLFPNRNEPELPRCETVGVSSICAGLAGLITAQKTINTILNIKDENNILTLINATEFSVNNINVKNNIKCILNNS